MVLLKRGLGWFERHAFKFMVMSSSGLFLFAFAFITLWGNIGGAYVFAASCLISAGYIFCLTLILALMPLSW